MKITQVRNATLLLDYAGTRFLIDPMLSAKGAFPGFEGTANSQLRNPLVELPLSIDELVDVDAVIVTAVFAATVPAVITNVALLLPAGTVTLTGTVATPVLDELSVTTLPPTGALVESVTVPVVVAVDAMLTFASVTAITFGPRIERVDLTLTP